MPSSNVVTITDQSGTLQSVQYVNGSADVTKDQKYQVPPTITQSGRVFKITFLADRKGSTDTADRFNQSSGGTAFEYAASGGGGTPEKLNFWFSLKLLFSTAQGEDVTTLNIGQGHFATTNNWWIGGSIVTSSIPCLSIPIGDSGLTLILPLKGTHDSFEFLPGRVG